MAEFSKQWCDLNDPEMPYDFDIDEIAANLHPGHYIPYICEGFGFTAIGKDGDGNISLYFPDYDDEQESHWMDYKTFIDSYDSKEI